MAETNPTVAGSEETGVSIWGNMPCVKRVLIKTVFRMRSKQRKMILKGKKLRIKMRVCKGVVFSGSFVSKR